MQTDEEFGQRIGTGLRAEAGALEIQNDVLLAGIRRRRKTAAVRVSLAATGAAVVVAAAGITLATAFGGAQPSGTAHAHAPTASAARHTIRVELDGYLVTLPAGLHVQKIGSGYLVQSPAGQFTIFLESGPNVGPPPGGKAELVQAGGKTGWWLGNGQTGQGGELWLRQPGWPAQVFLVAKALGATESQALAFANTLNVTTMPRVIVPATGG
jgi:hypothetical protein